MQSHRIRHLLIIQMIMYSIELATAKPGHGENVNFSTFQEPIKRKPDGRKMRFMADFAQVTASKPCSFNHIIG